uniref:Uncharacterized protein n=1 Tax=Ananas comosus var. bracteatus TaxID=296719 RepID=A0A6V7PNG8_ANACO|nr:unnamed protein product [Ananas comosus var. bracteatus]
MENEGLALEATWSSFEESEIMAQLLGGAVATNYFPVIKNKSPPMECTSCFGLNMILIPISPLPQMLTTTHTIGLNPFPLLASAQALVASFFQIHAMEEDAI